MFNHFRKPMLEHYFAVEAYRYPSASSPVFGEKHLIHRLCVISELTAVP